MIPVIADIFGVTCDELLRGERRNPAERAAETGDTLTGKGEKQLQYLLSLRLSDYRSQTYISMGISVVGLIAAMICNLGFLRAYIGFFVASIFYVGSIVFQVICTNDTFNRVTAEPIPAERLGAFKLSLFRICGLGASVNLVQGRQFDDYISFRRYMYEDHQPDTGTSESMTSASDEIPERRELRIDDGTPEGKLVCVYVYRNYDVMTVMASDTEDGLPLVAITYKEYQAAVRKTALINGCFIVLYALECVAVILIYRKKRMK